eukprot:10402863-Alexandrium_andersonii.AAC.1
MHCARTREFSQRLFVGIDRYGSAVRWLKEQRAERIGDRGGIAHVLIALCVHSLVSGITSFACPAATSVSRGPPTCRLDAAHGALLSVAA